MCFIANPEILLYSQNGNQLLIEHVNCTNWHDQEMNLQHGLEVFEELDLVVRKYFQLIIYSDRFPSHNCCNLQPVA